MRLRSTKTWLTLSAVLVFGIALVVVYFFPPTQYHFYPKCVLYQFTGLHCPGCGGTRAAHHLVHGKLIDALSMNALTVLLLPVLFATLVVQKIQDPKKPFLDLNVSSRVGWILAATVLGFGALRNLPLEPFSMLAPKETEIFGSETKPFSHSP